MCSLRFGSRRAGLVAIAAALALGNGAATARAGSPLPPPPNSGYDSQLGGAYPPPRGVGVVSRDRNDPPAEGLYSICYLNAFQTQAEEAEWWKKHHPDLLLRAEPGSYFEDSNWPGEILLDTSAGGKRAAILSVIGPWIDQCAKDGFQAIEPDNLDTWTRSQGKLDLEDNIAMAQLIVRRAHANGLAVAQKNASELGPAGKLLIGFDFAIVESCQAYNECDRSTAAYGDNVIEIEYPDEGGHFFAYACAARGAAISIVLRDRDLNSPDAAAYRYEAC